MEKQTQFLRCFCVLGLSIFLTSAANAASVNLTGVSTTATPTGGSIAGYTGEQLVTSGLASSSTFPITVSGLSATFNLGAFTLSSTNSNVTSTFTLTVAATLNNGGTPVTENFTFAGSVADVSGTEELQYGAASGSTGTYGQYTYLSYPYVPPGNQLFETETLSFGALGNFTLGVADDYAINTSTGKSTTLFSFITPASPSTPEPLTAGLTGLSIAGLLGFAAFRKLRLARS